MTPNDHALLSYINQYFHFFAEGNSSWIYENLSLNNPANTLVSKQELNRLVFSHVCSQSIH